MIIAIGSKNKVKIQAVEEVLQDYSLFKQGQVHSLETNSGISEQPLSLNETILGAKNRAYHAFQNIENCNYSIGIESGLMEVSHTKSGFMECCVCCIFDGEEFVIGQSSGFELPQNIVDLVIHQQLTLGDACYRSGLTNNPKLGVAEGAVGVLTKSRINRLEYTKQAIIMALIPLENAILYEAIPASSPR